MDEITLTEAGWAWKVQNFTFLPFPQNSSHTQILNTCHGLNFHRNLIFFFKMPVTMFSIKLNNNWKVQKNTYLWVNYLIFYICNVSSSKIAYNEVDCAVWQALQLCRHCVYWLLRDTNSATCVGIVSIGCYEIPTQQLCRHCVYWMLRDTNSATLSALWVLAVTRHQLSNMCWHCEYWLLRDTNSANNHRTCKRVGYSLGQTPNSTTRRT